MSYETLDFDVVQGVATITLNRPDNMNAMSPAMAAELHEAALAIDANSEVRAVIVTGAGKVFCAGGDRRTRELMLTNRVLTSTEALDWGVVNQVVADEAVLASAQKLAAKLAGGPTQAYGQVKALLDGSFDQSLESQMELEARAIAGLVTTTDGQEGLHAFLEKRRPQFSGG